MRVRNTHIVTWYGGNREEVAVVDDKTHRDYGFRYGSMLIESDGERRWIQFGLYNAIDIKVI